MRIVALHTDFRIYWPARLKALSDALHKREDSFDVIEIAGKGSHYAFAEQTGTQDLKWHILFPEAKPEELSGKDIEPKLYALLADLRPDVIIAGAIAFPSGALAVRWGQKTGCRVIVFDDSKIEAVKRNGIVNFIKHAVYNGVDAMFYPAEDWIATGNFWGFKPDEMFFGVDVVDNEFWSTPKPLTHDFGKYFVAVGRQIPKKNYYAITEAYKIYVDAVGRNDAYNLVLIGDGPEHARIAEFVEKNRLNEKVILLPFLTQDELPSIYQHAKALSSSSSSSETWGLVINEAMAGGCAIFASYECGAANVLVHDNINGYKFHCHDIQKQAEFMIKFHRLDDDRQSKMREASRRIIAEWGLPRFAAGAVAAIDHAMSKPKRGTSLIDKIIIDRWKGRYNPI